MNKNVLNSRVYKSKTNKKMPTRVYIRINCGIHTMEYYAAVKEKTKVTHRIAHLCTRLCIISNLGDFEPGSLMLPLHGKSQIFYI